MMKLNRLWITPLTAGAFLVSAVTGVLIFFHIETGANKFLHEWLSWALLIGAILHISTNFKALTKHLSAKIGMMIVGVFSLALAISFLPMLGEGKKDEPPFMASVRALSTLPIGTLAQIAKISPDEMKARLSREGLVINNDQQSISELMNNNPKKQMHLLAKVLNH